ncbi:dephospho-CoA kinase [Ancylostoma ceylanicum]|uniref:Dephospho-CoA kinase n=1 Tax=Ancylostoma ceylanicum TaxID=53326 RepID=A0A0D6L5K5_9BILA|nr:dephospho-CoA kinase [Ancylostoma ceylanicum]
MAGKSTYLRSVGLAIISANAGFPVLAASCSIPEIQLYSSMRTSDDLSVESSYFHAELTRLRFIMDAIESGKKVFVILDEILKGTNSRDKEIGSAGFLDKLRKIGAKGIIATHDLSLTELALKTPSFRNVYFDSTIDGEELYFDYKVREGVCQNMNASFLLKKMRDDSMREQVNHLIHPVVRADFHKWAEHQKSPVVFNEAAILIETGTYKTLDFTVLVTADKELRIHRTIERDGISREEVLARMSKQWEDEEKMKYADFVIYNDDRPLLIQLEDMLKMISGS